MLRALCFWIGAVELASVGLLLVSCAGLWLYGKWMARRAAGRSDAPGGHLTVSTAPALPWPSKANILSKWGMAPILHIDAASDAEAVDALLNEVNR